MKRLTVIALLASLVLGTAGVAAAEHGPQDPFRPIRTTENGSQNPWGEYRLMEHGPQDPFKPGGGSAY